MKISTMLSYAGGFRRAAAEVAELEKAGLDLVWVAEAYGLDSPSLMGYLAALTERVEIGSAILPIYTRTPTLIAMTAAGIDTLSEGRFHLGLGSSGPQVIEGWHGVPFTAPIGRTREIIDVCRQVWARGGPAGARGDLLPDAAAGRPGDRTGQGPQDHRPPGAAVHPDLGGRPRREERGHDRRGGRRLDPDAVHAREGPRASGVPPWTPGEPRATPSLGPLQITAGGPLAIGEGDEVTALRDLARPMVALYVGGMGAKGKNFYNDVVRRYGFEEEAETIQDLYLDGKKAEAEALVPDELLEATSLCGPDSYMAERIAAFEEAGVTHLQVIPIPTGDQRPVDLIATVKELAG